MEQAFPSIVFVFLLPMYVLAAQIKEKKKYQILQRVMIMIQEMQAFQMNMHTIANCG